MSEAQFTQLIELIGQAGEGAWPLAVLFLLESYFTGAVTAVVVVIIARWVYKIICTIFYDNTLAKTTYDSVDYPYHESDRRARDPEVIRRLQARGLTK